MRLNQSAFSGGSTKHVVSAEDVDSWINGTKIPSLYAIYKVTDFFNITIDSLLSSEPMVTNLVTGKSFAKQTASSPKVINTTTTTGAPEAKAKFYFQLALAQAGKGETAEACETFKNAMFGQFAEPSKAQRTILKCK